MKWTTLEKLNNLRRPMNEEYFATSDPRIFQYEIKYPNPAVDITKTRYLSWDDDAGSGYFLTTPLWDFDDMVRACDIYESTGKWPESRY